MSSADNNIILISLVITAVLAIMVIIAVVVLYKRRTSLRSRHNPLVPNNGVAYAQVNKPTKEKAHVHSGEPTRNNTADDTYDHMEHHRVSQNKIPNESNYDTMQSVGNGDLENDYDITSGTDRPRQIVVDDTVEYSHVAAVNQERM
ncbi:uncharacterized protein LOC143081752 [Mytilus galloprovincialis]|uniref:uncharacterized protein LOC143081752 n=1 Tax=Mytilus galloprovincialis TaxID=29158 RepID=UPI003F7CAEAE